MYICNLLSLYCLIMSCILHIETSTEVCSVAVSQDGASIFSKEDFKGPSHATELGTFVDEALSFADSHAIPVDAVAVSCGPGSYTGLRIGVSMAKGICYALGIPLIGLPTLEVMCVPVLLFRDLPEDALLCPMIDARRMEVYAAVYDRALRVKREISADIVDENAYEEFLAERPVYFFGNGAAKCKDKIKHPNAHFLDDVHPLAKWMFPLAEKAVANNDFKDVAYFEPFYLKEFVARKLPLPEYGRSVQNMVDHALTIEDRAERQRCANTIVNIMGGMFPQLRDMEDYRHKLWDHLAIMSDFKLDIDYPVEVVKKESLEVKPEQIPYSPNKINYRHYGRLIQDLIKIAVAYPEGEEKDVLVRYIANHMKKDYINWNKDGVEDQKILDDLCELSGGKIKLSAADYHLVEQRMLIPRRRQGQQNNNQKRKY